MYLENFPGLQEPIDEEEIEAAVFSASSAGSLKRRASDKMRNIPIEEVDFNGDQERGKTRRSGRSLPNWASSASSSRTISVEIVETQSGNVAGDGQCWRFLPPPCRKGRFVFLTLFVRWFHFCSIDRGFIVVFFQKSGTIVRLLSDDEFAFC